MTNTGNSQEQWPQPVLENGTVLATSNKSENSIRHMVVTVEAVNPVNGKRKLIKVFLDNGSDRTFITEELAQWLKLSAIDVENLTVSTFGNEKATVKLQNKIVQLHLTLKDGAYLY